MVVSDSEKWPEAPKPVKQKGVYTPQEGGGRQPSGSSAQKNRKLTKDPAKNNRFQRLSIYPRKQFTFTSKVVYQIV